MLEPFQPDKIPVVFVHGLMSRPRTWAMLFNDLLADPVLRRRYQFWFFQYPTGNPILYSASVLRESLLTVQETYDPDATNLNFQQMVICGHSMGGLLSKLQVHRSGDRLWKLVSEVPLESLQLSPDQRSLLKRVMFFDALPFVDRVVFMAVPHRGSEMATSFIGRLGVRLTRIPGRLQDTVGAVRQRLRKSTGAKSDADLLNRAITGISDLDPGNPVLIEVASWEFPNHLEIHSIIGNAVAADTPGGDDTVVPYGSSHLADARSEKIVKSGHKVHTTAAGILELRRILHLHLEEGNQAP